MNLVKYTVVRMTNVTTPVPDMTYYVFGGMLNLALSVYQCCQ